MISLKFSCVFAALCIACFANAKVNLPKGFILCGRNDPKFADCLKDAAKVNNDLLSNGIPELDFPPSNPLYLDHLDFSVGEQGSPLAFTVVLKNIIATYEVSSFDYFKMDQEKKTFAVLEHLKFLSIKANYTLSGRLLFGQINGQGGCILTLVEPTLSYDVKYSFNNKDGEDYVHVDSLALKVTPKTVHGYFDNLIGRDKNINDSLNKAINENWKLLYGPISAAVEGDLGKVLRERLNLFFDKVPYEQLFPA